MNMIMPQQEWMGLKYGTNHSASAGSRTTYTSRTCSTAKPTPEGGGMELHVDLKLNNRQVMCLLAGYCSIVSYWERLRLKPLNLPHVMHDDVGEALGKCGGVEEDIGLQLS